MAASISRRSENLQRGLRRLAVFASSLLFLGCAPAWAISTLVTDGKNLYTDTGVTNPLALSFDPGPCSGCHFDNLPPNTHQTATVSAGEQVQHAAAANNPQKILNAFAASGIMTSYLGTTALNPANTTFRDLAFKLSMYIGQYKAPVFKTVADGVCADPNLTINVRSGVAISKNAFPCLQDDGSGGVAKDGAAGLTITGATANAAGLGATQNSSQPGGVSALAYDVSYQSISGFTGADSFTLNVVNPSGTASKTIAANVYGITSGATANPAVVGQAYSGNAIYRIQSNDGAATFSASLVSPSAPLSTLGLSVDASGNIVGTVSAAPGTYTLRVVANIASATVGAANAGPVTQDLTLTIAAITSAATLNTTQNQAIATYTVASSPSATANSFTVSPSPLGNAVPGLSFNPSNGQITGTPTTSGSFQVTVGATTSSPSVGVTKVLTINVASAGPPAISATPTLPSSPAVAGTVGTVFPSTQINASNPPINAGSYIATGLPGGLAVNANTGVISGTATASGDFPLVLGATNSSGSSTANVTIRISPNAVPSITGSSGISTNANQPFAGYQINASNPVISSYAVVGATALPTGLTLNTSTGLISGTPTFSGVFNLLLRASNVVGPSADFALSLTVVPTTLPTVTAPFVAAPGVTGAVGSAIAPIQITATNPPITAYGATGLPAGLTVNGSGQIVGTPTQSGDFSVTVTADNAQGTGSSSPPVIIRISPNTVPAITSANAVSRNVNAASGLVYQITATNPPITVFAVVGSSVLPAGLNLNTSTGAISGSPTTSGIVTTNLSASNAAGASTPLALTFTIVPTLVPVVTAALPASPTALGSIGTPIAPIQINATNPAILSYGSTGLPSGLSVNGSGQIVGSPTVSGDFAVTLSATNAAGTSIPLSATLRINSNTVPVINSANAFSGSANTLFSGYQITATNGPIASYAVVAPSVLPAGLILNTGSGAISGTPTASGSFSTTLSASNAAGVSAPFALNITINPSTAPAITSPTFVTVAAGVPLQPIQVVATNPAITAFAATGLPPGLALNTSTGMISGTPTTPGSFSANLTATNVVASTTRAVPFTIGVPAPTACAMSVPLNTATILDIATCLFNGFAPTGVSIVATAAHGTAIANGTKVTYTPAHNYFGSDQFSFIGYGAGGTSPQGLVSVTITGRPDPSQDAVVTAVIAAQVETAQRFSRAQISNFQRRMESLHGTAAQENQGGAATLRLGSTPSQGGRFAAGVAVSAPVQVGSVVASVTTAARMNSAGAGGVAGMGTGAPGAGGYVFGPASNGPGSASEAQVVDAVASGLGIKSLPFSDSVLSMLKSRSVSLAGVASGLGLNASSSQLGNTSYWIEGVASFGTRDASGGLSGSEFSSDGISVGADKRFNEHLVMGMGLGYARGTTKIGTDGSGNRAKGYSLAVYGSYQPSSNTFVDGMLGFGSLGFDTTRFVVPINDYALGQRRGTQVFGSLTTGYEFRDEELLVSPYGRIDFSTSRLRSSTESGAGAFALTYFGQTTTSVQGALGVRGESIHATSFGYAVPRVRAEYVHEFQGNGQAFIGYADQIGGPRYALASANTGRDAIVLGIGSDFLMPDGLTLSFEYQLSHSFSHDSTYALRLRLTKEFDARGLPQMRKEYPVRLGKPLDIQVDAGYSMDDNVTRAKSGPDKLSDDSYSVNVSKTVVNPLSEQSRLLLTGALGGEKFRSFNGLSHALASGEAEYQYRESSDFDALSFGVFGKLTGESYETRLRDGYRLSAGISIRQALTDRINIVGALSRNWSNASSSVFSTRDNSVRTNIDYALNDAQTLYFGAEYRRGDIVSTGRASLENVSIAKVFAQDDAYPGGQFFSYRFGGTTVLTTLGYNLSLGNHDSVDFSWRRVRSTPGLRPSFVTSPHNYIDNQLSAVYLMRF
jgi:uncharacterized protein with beta-barrel porin domain